MIKWVDDFIFFQYPINNALPWQYSYDKPSIDTIATNLGWPWALKKHSPFASTFMYIGMTCDLHNKKVFFSQKKKDQYLAKLVNWNTGSCVMKKDVESVIGTLNQCSLVLIAARTHLPSLCEFARGFSGNSHALTSRSITSKVSNDIKWWRTQLSADFCRMILQLLPAPLNLRICMDASTSWGMGFWIEGKWAAWCAIPGWKTDGQDISWLEMVAVELALTAIIAAKYKNVHLNFHSDNCGVVGALSNGSSHNTAKNLILCRIIHLCNDNHIWVTTSWITSEDNPADDHHMAFCLLQMTFFLPFQNYLHTCRNS